MNDAATNEQFVFQALREAFNSPDRIFLSLSFLLGFAIIFTIIIIILSFNEKRKNIRKILYPGMPATRRKAGTFQEFNIAQQKIVFDLIAEFKAKEKSAQPVQDTLLERFSEHLYNRMGLLDIDKQSAEKIAPKIYPITPGQRIEIELIRNNILYIFERTAQIVNDKAIVVAKIINSDIVFTSGSPVYIRYTVENKFISGKSKVMYTQAADQIVFAYPKNLVVSRERRFDRIPVGHVEGEVMPEESQTPFRVLLIDIGIEGVKIRSNIALKKDGMFRLSFFDSATPPGFVFRDLDCIVSQSYIIKENRYEYGMSFMYIDIANRERLKTYIAALVEKSRKNLPNTA
jgi:hypothetical protein